MSSLKVAIYESLDHFVPGGVGWYEGLENLGHDPYILEFKHDLNAYQLPESPDFLVVMGITPEMLVPLLTFKDKHPTTKIIVNFFGFRDYFLRLKDVVDLWVEPFMKHEYVRKRFEENDLPLLFLPLGATESIYHKITDEFRKSYDVSFVGGFGGRGHGYRGEDTYLFPVIDKQYKGFFGGFEYKGISYPTVKYSFLNEVYNSTRVNLNFHYEQQKKQDPNQEAFKLDFNTRVYEIALSNNFQISDHPEVLNVFNGAIPYITKEDWLDAIEYYLNKPELRQELALKANKICLEKHTWKQRMVDFLKHVSQN